MIFLPHHLFLSRSISNHLRLIYTPLPGDIQRLHLWCDYAPCLAWINAYADVFIHFVGSLFHP